MAAGPDLPASSRRCWRAASENWEVFTLVCMVAVDDSMKGSRDTEERDKRLPEGCKQQAYIFGFHLDSVARNSRQRRRLICFILGMIVLGRRMMESHHLLPCSQTCSSGQFVERTSWAPNPCRITTVMDSQLQPNEPRKECVRVHKVSSDRPPLDAVVSIITLPRSP
jgi:hypothetical protein